MKELFTKLMEYMQAALRDVNCSVDTLSEANCLTLAEIERINTRILELEKRLQQVERTITDDLK